MRSFSQQIRTLSVRMQQEGLNKPLPISISDVYKARERIGNDIHVTPIHTCSYLDNISGYHLYFKCENLQKTGSFKVCI